MTFKALAASFAAASLLVPAIGGSGAQAAPVAAPASTAQSAAQLAAIARRKAFIAALQRRVKYVFVLYQENRSFDSYFGTFPGADGLFSRDASQTLGFRQKI